MRLTDLTALVFSFLANMINLKDLNDPLIVFLVGVNV